MDKGIVLPMRCRADGGLGGASSGSRLSSLALTGVVSDYPPVPRLPGTTSGRNGLAPRRTGNAAGGIGSCPGDVEAADRGAPTAEAGGRPERTELVQGDVEVHGMGSRPAPGPLHVSGVYATAAVTDARNSGARSCTTSRQRWTSSSRRESHPPSMRAGAEGQAWSPTGIGGKPISGDVDDGLHHVGAACRHQLRTHLSLEGRIEQLQQRLLHVHGGDEFDAGIRSPSSRTTAVTRSPSTSIRATAAEQRSSPPSECRRATRESARFCDPPRPCYCPNRW